MELILLLGFTIGSCRCGSVAGRAWTQGPLSSLQCQTNEMKRQNKTMKNPLHYQLNPLLEGHHFFTCVLFPLFSSIRRSVSLLFFLGIEHRVSYILGNSSTTGSQPTVSYVLISHVSTVFTLSPPFQFLSCALQLPLKLVTF